ncbi:hypothetical protein [Actinoplanes derwentensis]|uniref:Uncharacterized protein n=1 Tax=Actinoplanes derwentensis TaxID=113562 RepID=A0A1H2A7F9_9ACTN|nr:hypothetical protein [Actinoplanes derwentensis]GID88478.1 hypothetical protein Ade03nite_74020 [Actinoplanes derwentensis]SDT41915.1 hypothetical protein SAMN04489716_3706 [Actinoplanes derwentensis]
MITAELLAVLDPLSFRQRLSHVAVWARTAANRAEVTAELRAGGPYERRLALVAAITTGDEAGIRAACGDETPAIRGEAFRAALRAGLDVWHEDLPAADRRRIYHALRLVEAPGVADELITRVAAAHGDAEAAMLLTACGPDVVRRSLPVLEHAVNLSALARRHPGPFLERVTDRLDQAPTADVRDRIWTLVADALLHCDPAGVLDLLERFGPEDRLPGRIRGYGRIAAVDPARLAHLIAAPGRAAWTARNPLPRAVLRRLAVLPAAGLAPIAVRLRDRPWQFTLLLKNLPPARRGELYDAAGLSAVDVPSTDLIEVLPHAVRIREATRVLTLPQVRDHETMALAWSGFLAWPQASAAASARLRSGAAVERAQAWTVLISAARRSRDPQAVAEVLSGLPRLRNEQDPVRFAALSALAGAAHLLRPLGAGALTRVVTDAVEARDTHQAVMNALSALATETLRLHVDVPELREWALLTIDLTTTTAKVPALRRFGPQLRRGQETMVFDRLRGWVTAAFDRGDVRPLFALTRALGKRARLVPELQELLGRATEPPQVQSVAREAIALWLDDPRERPHRVETLLAADPSTVTIDTVWNTIDGNRTDLLDRVLDAPPRGRFVGDEGHWLPRESRPERWLPRQQARYAELLRRDVDDTGLTAGQRAHALATAARIPVAGRDMLLRYVDSPDVVLAETALAELVWTDNPAGALVTLLARAGDDRARVALYAAGRSAADVPPSRLTALLVPLLTATEGVKVTSRKEVARLLGQYGEPAVMAVLRDAWADPSAHRDVRAAIVSAARQRLAVTASWTILSGAADGSREERRAVLGADPWRIAERHRERFASLIAAACRSEDRELRREALARLPLWASWTTEVGALALESLTDLDEPPVAAGELLRVLDGADLRTVLLRLADLDAADERPGDAGSDRPAYRRLNLILTLTADRARLPRTVDWSVEIAAARELAARPGLLRPAAGMLLHLGWLSHLDEVADRCAGQPVLAAGLAGTVRDVAGDRDHDVPAEVLATAGRMATRGDLAGGLFATALAERGGTHGWAGPWRSLLLTLRAHPDAAVRGTAYDVDMTLR